MLLEEKYVRIQIPSPKHQIAVFVQTSWPFFSVPVAVIRALNRIYKKRLMMRTLSYSAPVSKITTVPGQAGKVAHSLY